MRLSSSLFHEQSINAITDQQSQVSETQLKIASGKNLLTPSEDPVKSTQILAFKQELSILTQLSTNSDFAETRNQLEETTLNAIQETYFRIRDLIVQGKNTILPQSSLTAIKDEIDLRVDELVGLANTKDGSGEYIFGGFEGKSIPFTRDPNDNKLIYSGDQGQRYVKIGFNVQIAVSDSGHDIFQDIKQGNGTFFTENRGFVDITADPPVKGDFTNTGTGVINTGTVSNAGVYVPTNYEIEFVTLANGSLGYNIVSEGNTYDPITLASGQNASDVANPIPYIEGSTIEFNGVKAVIKGEPDAGDKFSIAPSTSQSIFTTLENSIEHLADPNDVEKTNGLNRVLTNLDQALDNLLIVRSRIGARLNTIDVERTVNQSFTIFTEKSLSKLQDLDFAKAASDLSRQALALEAAQQSFVRIQGLSLFNFLR